MALRDRILKIAPYFKGIEYEGGLIIVKVQLPEKIEPKNSKDDLIKVAFHQGLWMYYAKMELVEEDAIFDLIEETVKVYEEAKQKVTLMKAKFEELKLIFANNSLDKLETLKFVFEDKPKSVKPKRKYTKKTKTNTEEEIPTVEGELIEN